MKYHEEQGRRDSSLMLSVGDQLPDVAFKDIDGHASSMSKLSNKIQVVSFANRESGLKLRGWLRHAGLKVAKDYPQLEVVHLGFADVSKIPKMLRHIVKPLLRSIHNVSRNELESAYGNREALYLTPDWDGRYLEQFGLRDAERYTCWIVQSGRIIEEFGPDTENSEERFLSLFGQLATEKSYKRHN